MSRRVSIPALRRHTCSWAALAARPAIVWWPTSLPGSDLDDRPRRRPAPAKRRIRRGRIQLVAA